MKLLQRFRKQGSREEMETQAAQELEAAMAAKPADVPAMAPTAGLPGDDMSGSGGAGEIPGAADAAAQGENGEALGSVTDLPKRRSATTRNTGARKPATSTRAAGTKAGAKAGIKAGAATAKPAAKEKSPVRQAAVKKTASGGAGGTVKKGASAAGTSGRASASRQPAAKKRQPAPSPGD